MDEQTRKNLMDAIALAIANATVKAAYLMEREARNICPVDTGALKASIHLEEGQNGEIILTAGKDYAEYVEFGTMHMRAQPYIRPAVFAYVQRILPQVIKTELQIMAINWQEYRRMPRATFIQTFVSEPKEIQKRLKPYRKIARRMRQGAKLVKNPAKFAIGYIKLPKSSTSRPGRTAEEKAGERRKKSAVLGSMRRRASWK